MNEKDRPLYRKLLLCALKFAPSILALTCCAKITLLVHNEQPKNFWLLSVNWINWVLNMLFLGVFYVMGRYFGYCWKHQSLCRLAMWGYLYYAAFLVSAPPKEMVRPVVHMYIVIIVVFTALYKRV